MLKAILSKSFSAMRVTDTLVGTDKERNAGGMAIRSMV